MLAFVCRYSYSFTLNPHFIDVHYLLLEVCTKYSHMWRVVLQLHPAACCSLT